MIHSLPVSASFVFADGQYRCSVFYQPAKESASPTCRHAERAGVESKQRKVFRPFRLRSCEGHRYTTHSVGLRFYVEQLRFLSGRSPALSSPSRTGRFVILQRPILVRGATATTAGWLLLCSWRPAGDATRLIHLRLDSGKADPLSNEEGRRRGWRSRETGCTTSQLPGPTVLCTSFERKP